MGHCGSFSSEMIGQRLSLISYALALLLVLIGVAQSVPTTFRPLTHTPFLLRNYQSSSVTPGNFIQRITRRNFIQRITPRNFIQDIGLRHNVGVAPVGTTPTPWRSRITPRNFIQDTTPGNFIQDITPGNFIQDITLEKVEELVASKVAKLLAEQETHAHQELMGLRQLVESLQTEKDQLEERMQLVEFMTPKRVPRSCEEVKNKRGVKKSGEYQIDPDGPDAGKAPITAYCDMETGATWIRHDIVGSTEVEHCPDAGCHQMNITYKAPVEQIRALVALSEDCSQSVKYECFGAPLTVNTDQSLAWWLGLDGVPKYYWDGSHNSNEHSCACGYTNSCGNTRFQCNCDASAPKWLSDEGVLKDKDALPVTQLRFGGLVYRAQQAKFELGPLKCSGQKAFKVTQSCETLRMAGNVASGYYWVDSPAGVTLVACNMDLQPNNPRFEVETSVEVQPSNTHTAPPGIRIAFDFSRQSNYGITESVVPYQKEMLNIGGAMSLDGVFRAPVDGVYAFTFFFDESSSIDERTTVLMRKNGLDTIATMLDAMSYDRGLNGDAVITTLVKNETVDIFLKIGVIGNVNQGDAHFTGHLLFAL